VGQVMIDSKGVQDEVQRVGILQNDARLTRSGR
jgi:hypothetical protein